MPDVLAFSTDITVDDQQVLVASDKLRGTKAWGRANSIFCPLGPAPTRAWLLMSRLHAARLGGSSTHSLRWAIKTATNDAASAGDTSVLTFQNLYLAGYERIFTGGQDTDAAYLVELVDGRYLAEKNSSTGAIQANIRSYANSADYLAGTTTYGTWETLLEALWTACETLGEWPGLPPGLPIDGVPENAWFLGLNAYRSLNAVLDLLDCAINPNPLEGTYSIVQLGADQTINANTSTLKWNGQPFTMVADKAAQLSIWHYAHYKTYGQERDTELEDNWAVTTPEAAPTPIETEITGASGTLSLWDDLPLLFDETNTQTNTAAILARDQNRKDRYITRHSVGSVHRVHWGLTTDFVPGGQIKACLWRNWGDGNTNQIGGTVTEFKACSELITGLDSDRIGEGLAWLDKQLVAPEREAYAPPDCARHSYPNYPRLPNIVQVHQGGYEAGETVQPDGETSGGVKLHSGRVKRWVANGMVTLDPCWILFVDNYDTNFGDVRGVEDEYYGPARLSGVSTAGGTLRPVYVVRNGDEEATDPPSFVVFEITAGGTGELMLPMAGLANAKICYVDPFLGEYVASTAPEDAIVVSDFYRSEGQWQGYAGYKGVAKRRSSDSNKYDIIWMERPALFVRSQLTGEFTGTPPECEISPDLDTYFQQGEKVHPDTTVFDPDSIYPLAGSNCKAISAWDDRNKRRQIIVSQQQGIFARADLLEDMLGPNTPAENRPITGFVITSFSPFNKTPIPLPTTAHNLYYLWGQQGSTVQLIWDHVLELWVIIQVYRRLTEPTFLVAEPATATTYSYGDISSDMFRGFTHNLIGLGAGELGSPCYIRFSDYDQINTDFRYIVRYHKVYGPGKFIGTYNNSPIYQCLIGEQEWYGVHIDNLVKNTIADFTLYYEGLPVSITVPARVRFNGYTGNQAAIIKVIEGEYVANQIECDT